MSAYDLNQIELAIINELRYNITDPLTRGSTASESFSGNNLTTSFGLSNNSNSIYLTVGGTEQKYGTDYTINTTGNTITFTSAPTTGTNNITAEYKHGPTWIYPDFNKAGMTLSDFPRISCSIISSNTLPLAIGGEKFRTSLILSITVAGKTRQQINNLIQQIRNRLLTKTKNFGLFVNIEPSAESAIQNSNLHNRILQRTIDFVIPYKDESV